MFLFAFSFVSGKLNLVNNNEIKIDKILSKDIYLESKDLNNSIISYKSNFDISSLEFYSICSIKTQYLNKNQDIYFFKISFLDKDCHNWNIFLYDKNNSKVFPNTWVTLKFFDESELFSSVVDFDDAYLKEFLSKINNNIDKLSIYKNYDLNYVWDFFGFLKNNRVYKELNYVEAIVKWIIDARDLKYQIPVPWYELPTRRDKIPNAWRAYRKEYTDWIHHSWDIDAPFNTKVVSLDYWIVVRVVDNWKWSDFSKLVATDSRNEELQTKNLDIYRWNQVWIKTAKWDVVFYNHLNNIYSDITVWKIVRKGYPLWTIWFSWVPDKSYTDYHLDFAIHKNPYDI
jgi:hypothetical protein